jgi:hypothetical protein
MLLFEKDYVDNCIGVTNSVTVETDLIGGAGFGIAIGNAL